METTTKIPMTELRARLRQRDGDNCMHPDCGRPLDFSVDADGNSLAPDRMAPTIDHVYPVSRCKADNWSFERIWALNNLQLFHKACNAKKGDKVYLPDGTLPAGKPRKALRAEKRASRPVLMECCYGGRILLPGEICPDCGRESMTHTIPAEYVVKTSECPHSGPWSCWSCYIGHTPREAAIVTVLDGSVQE